MKVKHIKKSPRYAKVPLLLGLASLLFYPVIMLGLFLNLPYPVYFAVFLIGVLLPIAGFFILLKNPLSNTSEKVLFVCGIIVCIIMTIINMIVLYWGVWILLAAKDEIPYLFGYERLV